jgi:hypothetical protein
MGLNRIARRLLLEHSLIRPDTARVFSPHVPRSGVARRIRRAHGGRNSVANCFEITGMRALDERGTNDSFRHPNISSQMVCAIRLRLPDFNSTQIPTLSAEQMARDRELGLLNIKVRLAFCHILCAQSNVELL